MLQLPSNSLEVTWQLHTFPLYALETTGLAVQIQWKMAKQFAHCPLDMWILHCERSIPHPTMKEQQLREAGSCIHSGAEEEALISTKICLSQSYIYILYVHVHGSCCRDLRCNAYNMNPEASA